MENAPVMTYTLANGDISAGHARALLGLKDEESMVMLAHRVIEKDLSVREVEQIVKKMNTASTATEVKDEYVALDSEAGRLKLYIKEVEHRAMSAIGKKVRITHTPRKKTLEIAYETNEDLENMLKILCGDDIFDNI